VGVTETAVRNAIRAGRLERSLGSARGKPCVADRALAEQEWKQNRDMSKVRGSATPSMAHERKRLLAAQAQRAELDNAKKSGELVSAREVGLRWASLVTETRNHLLGIPSRMKQLRPELSAPALLALDNLIRESLTALADRGDANEK
jgi:phage terminase Nu1 subunit (DNA packaging protein)